MSNLYQEFNVQPELILSKEQAYVAHIRRLKFKQNSNPVCCDSLPTNKKLFTKAVFHGSQDGDKMEDNTPVVFDIKKKMLIHCLLSSACSTRLPFQISSFKFHLSCNIVELETLFRTRQRSRARSAMKKLRLYQAVNKTIQTQLRNSL